MAPDFDGGSGPSHRGETSEVREISADLDVTDAELMAAIAGGDESAWLALYRRHNPHVFAVCLRILHNWHDAEDVLSQVFWEVWKSSENYDASKSRPLTYLLLLGRSRSLDRLRSNGRKLKTIAMGSEADPDCDRQLDSESAGGSLEDRERSEAVRQILSQISLNQREALELAFFEGMTHEEISESLQTPLGTVKTRIRQGLLNLRRLAPRLFAD